jgi:hypothetical protein
MSAPPSPHPELVELETPLGREWEPVVRLVLGGIADRVGLGFEELDDLQLAVERLLAEAGAQPSVRIAVELDSDHVRTHVGPLREETLSEALQSPSVPGQLGLRRVLETLVDSFGVDEAADGELVVRLEKRIPPR